MKYIVNLSGGKTSMWALKMCIEQKGLQNTEAYFANTKGPKDKDNPHAGEDADSYRFLKDIATHFHISIHSVSDGRNIWDVMQDKRAIKIPQQDYAPCSGVLKRDVLNRAIYSRYKPDEITMVFGMQWHETHRMLKLYEIHTCRIWFPLMDFPFVTEDQIDAYLITHNIAIPRLYTMGFEHNNCGGFCVRAGKAHFARLWYQMPERYIYHEEKELALCAYLGKRVTILREKVNGENKQVTLREFRERLQAGDTRYDPNDFGACGCFVNGT